MNEIAIKLAEYCKRNFDFNQKWNCNYGSLSICILDCVYSLRARYDSIRDGVVTTYADQYLGGDKNAVGDSVSDLIAHITSLGGTEAFALLLDNHNKLGRNSVPKEKAVLELAEFLKALRIETPEDFMGFRPVKLLESAIKGVDGISDAGMNYLFMLAGDVDRVKPDVHIHHAICDACNGKDKDRIVSDKDCQIVYWDATQILRKDYPDLTPRDLDHIVWTHYSHKKRL